MDISAKTGSVPKYAKEIKLDVQAKKRSMDALMGIFAWTWKALVQATIDSYVQHIVKKRVEQERFLLTMEKMIMVVLSHQDVVKEVS